MRKGIVAGLAYAGAALTLLIAACVPFVLIGTFTNLVAHAGLHVDTAYTGGSVARTIERKGYEIVIYQPVRPRALQRIETFQQIVFKPAAALPVQVSEEIDLDGDGKPDVKVIFAVPADPRTPLRGDVVALSGKYQSLKNASGESFSRLMVRVNDEVVVRVPLNEVPGTR